MAAFFNQSKPVKITKPSVDKFKTDNQNYLLKLLVENLEACKRYSGVSIKGVNIKESPEWLRNRLKAIGQKPINNIVDITNFVLHELGQPLHAFDADKITGNKIIVRTTPNGTSFITLDGVEQKLTSGRSDDL